MALYAVDMTELQVNGNLVELQACRFQFFSKEDVITKYEVEQCPYSPSFTVFHCYTQKDVDKAKDTTTNVLFITKIKTFQLYGLFCGNSSFRPNKVNGDRYCLYQVIALHPVSCCFQDPWTERFPHGKKSETKQAVFEVVKDLKDFITHWNDKGHDILRKYIGNEVNIDDTTEVNEFIDSKRR